MIYHVKNKTQTKFAFDYLKSIPLIGADTETNGLDPFLNQILLIQLGNTKHQFVFDMAQIPKEDYKYIFKILEEENIVKIFQNGKFDYKMLKSNYNIQVKSIADTMITEQLLTKGIQKRGFGLDDLAIKYRAGFKNKDIREEFIDKKFGTNFSKEAIEYAANDVAILIPIYNAQLKVAAKINDMFLDLIDLENRTVSVMGKMELNGIFVNKKKWVALEITAKKEQKLAEAKLKVFFEPYYDLDMFGDLELNYQSPPQMKKALEKVLDRTLESTNEKYLNSIDASVIDALFEYREATKKITTYGTVFLDHIHPKTGRIHANFLQLGADSGRMSCKFPNLQNLPRQQEYRTPFCVQDPNWVFISADFSGQELRVLTELSKEPAFISALKNGKDLHKLVASILYRKPENEISKDERDKAKSLNFGLVYGISPYGLAKTLKITKSEAKELMTTFYKNFPYITNFLRKRANLTHQHRRADSPLDGRTRDLGKLNWTHYKFRNHGENIGKNHPIQGAAASVTKLALIYIQDYINKNKKEAKILAVIHDECLVSSHKDIAKEMKKIIEQEMIRAFHHYCPNTPMEVKAIIGKHWVH